VPDVVTAREHTRSGERVKVELRHADLADLLGETSAHLMRLGGAGDRLQVSVRASGGHQNGLYFAEIPLHNLRSQALDLSLFPLSALGAVQASSGGVSALGGSGEIAGRISLEPRALPVGRDWAVEMRGSTQQVAELGLSAGLQNKGGGGALSLSLSGGPGGYLYTDLHGTSRRRQHAEFVRGASVLQWSATPGWATLSGVIGGGRVKRGEPGPEGFERPGRHSDQDLLYASAQLRPLALFDRSTFKSKLSLYGIQHRYAFFESEPLWQSQGTSKSELTDRRLGGSTYGMSTHKWGRWGAHLSGSYTLATTQSITASRAQMGFAPTVSLFLNRRVALTLTMRADHNSERHLLWVPHAELSYMNPQRLGLSECQLRAGRAFRDPGFDERFLVGPGLLPNPKLRYEDGGWTDLRCALILRGKTRLGRWKSSSRVTAFYQELSRLILYVPLDLYRVRATDDLSVEMSGVELFTHWRSWIDRTQETPLPISLRGHLTLQRHHLTRSPFTPLPLRPTLHGWVRLSIDPLPISGWIKATGRNSVTADRFGYRRLPEALLWHLGVERRWTWNQQRLSLGLSFRNLFNAPTHDFILRPLPGRSIWLSFSIKSRP
jgi:hypothetical protein